MLTLFEGGFRSLMHDELISAIKKATDEKKRVFLIVPEQQTVMAECEMSELLPDSAPLYFEVTNFTRFTNTAFRTMGGISGEYCSSVAKTLTMWRTLTELSPLLSLTRGRTVISPGAVKKAMSAVAEMQSLGIDPADIRNAAEGERIGGRLGEKLSDLSLIYSLYRTLIAEKYTDAANDAAALATLLADSADFLSDTEIFIDGFTSFTEGQYKLIGEMIRHAPITVCLAIDSAAGDAFESLEVRDARKRLVRLADATGGEKRLKRCKGRDPSRSPVIGEIADLLWRSEGEIDNNSLQELSEDGGRVRIFAAKAPYEECEFIASDIRRRVIEGARYSDFAIVARSTEPYLGILDTALESADVPYFLARAKDLSSSPAIKLINTAYAAIRSYKRENVLTYMKCGLAGVSREERDEFELYTQRWSIDGRRFTDGIMWNMNPRGYTDMREGDSEKLIRIDGVRRRLIEPLMALEGEVKSARTVKEHAEVLLSFLTSLDIEEQLHLRAEMLKEVGEVSEADECSRIWGVICDSLDAVVTILGDSPADAESFLNQLTVAISGATVGRIPAHADEVTIGAADMLRIRDKKHIYLLGVNAGEFPAGVTDTSFFSERDKRTLSELGLPIEPDLDKRGARELYCFSRAFSQADSTVTLLYAEKNAMMGEMHPADVIKRIVDITKGAVTPIRIGDIDTADALWSPAAALEALGSLSADEYAETVRALSLSGYSEVLRVAEGGIKNSDMTLSKDTLALLYRGDLYLSQTRIDQFLGCPMSYFLKYNVGLNTDERAELGANVIGSFVHAVIENFFIEAERLGKRIGELSDEERGALTERCADRYMRHMLGGDEASARIKIAISRLTRATRPVIDGLCEEFAHCKYEPTFFELETSSHRDDLPDHLTLTDEDGGRVVIRGKIDRVDTYRHGGDVYVRVVDYKTGRNDFLPSKLKDGEYLQMFLYLKAIADTRSEGFLDRLGVEDGGRVVPAGVVYVKTKVADTTVKRGDAAASENAVGEMQKRDGMVLSDPTSLEAMNPDFMPPTPGARQTKFEPREYTEDGWHEIENTIKDVVLDVAGKMKRGGIKATPATRGGRNCKWCKFKEICRSAVIKNDF